MLHLGGLQPWIKADQVPDPNTIWTIVGNDILTPSSPVSLVWDNGNGVTFMLEATRGTKGYEKLLYFT